MNRYSVLERSVITAHRLSRNLLPLEREKMFIEVLRIAQEESGFSYTEVLAVLQEAADRMKTKIGLQRDRQSEWLDKLREWLLQEPSVIKKQDFLFVPVAKVHNWAAEQQIPFEQLKALLKDDERFGRWVETGAIRFSKQIRVGKDTPRCYGFAPGWFDPCAEGVVEE